MAEQAGEIFYTVDIQTKPMVEKVDVADKQLDRLQKNFDDTDKSAGRLNSGLSALSKAIAAVIAASTLRDMANLVQRYQEMSERVQMATESQAEFEMVQKRLLATANQSYRSLGEAQELYIRTADSLRSLGYTTEQALDVTDSMSFAFVKNATSAERAGAAISAFSKSVNTGKVAADQWETISSALPTIIDDIATASGMAASEVRALGAAGKLTATQLTEGLRKSLESNADAAAKMANNLTDAGVRAETALTQVLVSLESQTGALQAVTDGIIAAADAMLEFGLDSEKMAGFLESATTAATALAVVLGARLLSAMTGYTAALVQQAAASVAATRAADANLRLAQAEAAAAANALIQAKATAQATVGLSTHAAAMNTLAAAEARAATATAAFTAAQATANNVARVGTAVMGGLRTAMALLGGPAGVIFLAAGALASYAFNASEAKPKTDALTASVGQLATAAERAAERFERLTTGMGKLNRTELSVRKGELEDQLRSAEAQLKSFERQFQRGVGSLGQVEGARAAVDELRKALEKLNGTAPAGAEPVLTNPTVDDGKPSKAQNEAARAAEAIADQVEALQLQADTLGMTETELELYKLQLAGATDEQIRAAASSLAMVDAYRQQTDAAEAAEEARKKIGDDPAAFIRGDVRPLSGGAFDDQTARYDAERAAEEVRYAEQLERLRQAKEAEVQVVGGYQALEEEMARQHADRLAQIDQARQSVMLSTAADTFGSLAGLASQFAGEQSGIYKAMFAASKAFALADAAVKIQAGIASAAAIPFPANLAAIGTVIAATSSILSTISGTNMAGGRQYGGPVSADGMYRVNENGAPEVFQAANGRQYMLPNTRGEVISNKDATSGDGGNSAPIINVNNYSGQQANATARFSERDRTWVVDIVVGDMMSDGRIGQATNRITGTPRAGQ